MPRTRGRLDGGASSLLPEQVIKEPPAELHQRDLLYRRAPHWAPRHAPPIKLYHSFCKSPPLPFFSLSPPSVPNTTLFIKAKCHLKRGMRMWGRGRITLSSGFEFHAIFTRVIKLVHPSNDSCHLCCSMIFFFLAFLFIGECQDCSIPYKEYSEYSSKFLLDSHGSLSLFVKEQHECSTIDDSF